MLRNSNNGVNGPRDQYHGFSLNRALHTQNSIDEEASAIDLRMEANFRHEVETPSH